METCSDDRDIPYGTLGRLAYVQSERLLQILDDFEAHLAGRWTAEMQAFRADWESRIEQLEAIAHVPRPIPQPAPQPTPREIPAELRELHEAIFDGYLRRLDNSECELRDLAEEAHCSEATLAAALRRYSEERQRRLLSAGNRPAWRSA